MNKEDLLFLCKSFLNLTENNNIEWRKIDEHYFSVNHLGMTVGINYFGSKDRIQLELSEAGQVVYTVDFTSSEKVMYLEYYYLYCAARNQWNKNNPY
jgi:hypothetical protein